MTYEILPIATLVSSVGICENLYPKTLLNYSFSLLFPLKAFPGIIYTKLIPLSEKNLMPLWKLRNMKYI